MPCQINFGRMPDNATTVLCVIRSFETQLMFMCSLHLKLKLNLKTGRCVNLVASLIINKTGLVP